MHIFHINSYYSEFYNGFYKEQIADNLDIEVYMPLMKGHNKKLDKSLDFLTLSENHNKFDRLTFFSKQRKIYKDVIKNINIKDISLSHAHSLFANGYIAYKLKKDYNIPYVVAVRNTDVNIFFDKIFILRNLGNKILANADRVVFISKPYLNYTIDTYVPKKLQKEIYNKSVVLPNGIDEFWHNNNYKRTSKPADKNLSILFVGKVDHNKNIETTIEAIKILIQDGYKIKYKIIGKIYDPKYKKLIEENNFITYLPFCNKKELLNHYREADIFVMPSKKETFGLVYVEAMSQGLPVIYTKDQGFDGFFKDGTVGYAVTYNSAKQIVASIKKVEENYLSISDNCIEGSKRFNWHSISQDYKKLYKEVI